MIKKIKTLPTRENVTLYRLPEVLRCIGLSKSSIYRKIAQNNFPHPVRIGEKAVAWRSDHIQQWIDNLPEAMGRNPMSNLNKNTIQKCVHNLIAKGFLELVPELSKIEGERKKHTYKVKNC